MQRRNPATWLAMALSAGAIGLTIVAIVWAYPRPWRVIASPGLFTAALIWAWARLRRNPTLETIDSLMVYSLLALLGWAVAGLMGILAH